jgi:predicted nucleic acid-binding protein
VILVDANLLVYSHVKSFAQHERARQRLDQQLNGATRVGPPGASL